MSWNIAPNPGSVSLPLLLRALPRQPSLLPHNILSFSPCLLFLSCGSACSHQKHICSRPKDITIHCYPVQEFFRKCGKTCFSSQARIKYYRLRPPPPCEVPLLEVCVELRLPPPPPPPDGGSLGILRCVMLR